jgi:hypothetical protein
VSRRLKRAQRPGRVFEEKREVDPNGRIVLRHRTVDSLGKMLRAGTITQEMCDAGRGFQANFAVARLDPLRARPMEVPPGGGRASDLTDRQLDASGRVHAAMEALGGMSSQAGACVWHILGCGCSVREWALRQRWAGRPIRQEQAAGILIAALGVLSGERWH